MTSSPLLERGKSTRVLLFQENSVAYTLLPQQVPLVLLMLYLLSQILLLKNKCFYRNIQKKGGMSVHRLDKLLVGSGKWTRKEAKVLLQQGRVKVNGLRVTDGNVKFPVTCSISVDGEQLESLVPLWIMLHKPQGYVSAREDKLHDTVMDLLPPHYQKRGLFPVGRLDKDTEGLLLLTEDGETAHQLLSPTKHVPKVYYVEVEGMITANHVETVASGMTLGDGFVCQPALLEPLDLPHQGKITLTQGKYHQIKRMMARLGTPVTYLKRLSMAGLLLDESLDLGEWRLLTLEEITSFSSVSEIS